jgi:hypothetical protein
MGAAVQGVVRAPSVRSALLDAVPHGVVTAGAVAAVFAGLDKVHVTRAYDGGDETRGLYLGLLAVTGAALVSSVVVIVRNLSGVRSPRTHAVVPLFLGPVVPLVLFAGGGERSRLKSGALWTAAAVALHLVLGLAARQRLARRILRTALGFALICAVAFLVALGCQERWRAENFRAVGLPLYLPEVPGYQLTSSYAGYRNVIMLLEKDPAHPQTSHRIDVWISRRSLWPPLPCVPGRADRFVDKPGEPGAGLMFCLPENAVMVLRPRDGTPSIEALFPTIVARQVDASVLARHPDGAAWWEAD